MGAAKRHLGDRRDPRGPGKNRPLGLLQPTLCPLRAARKYCICRVLEAEAWSFSNSRIQEIGVTIQRMRWGRSRRPVPAIPRALLPDSQLQIVLQPGIDLVAGLLGAGNL